MAKQTNSKFLEKLNISGKNRIYKHSNGVVVGDPSKQLALFWIIFSADSKTPVPFLSAYKTVDGKIVPEFQPYKQCIMHMAGLHSFFDSEELSVSLIRR